VSQRTGKRYSVEGPFRPRDETDWGPVPVGIQYSVADLREVSGQLWPEGAHRVQLSADVRQVTGMRSRTFYGESAWAEAARYIDDVDQKRRRL
jgi:hypothetical protein